MGLFRPPKAFRLREFDMPCTPNEAMSVILETPDYIQDDPISTLRAFGDLYTEYGQIDIPPLVETIYLDNVRSTSFDIVAGNRTCTYWRLNLSLFGNQSTQGIFKSVKITESNRWYGDVLTLIFTLERAVKSVGGSKRKWPI